ncbi:MAG: PQQ-dependent sugar dehydrogenase [Hyphomicrobiales bacterium]|nr:PQQ-dependent sugar dehydrogenase [Hyphomicrobiales bacterium]
MGSPRLRANLAAALVAIAWLSVGSAWAQTFDTETGPIEVETIVRGLDHPWGLAFVSDHLLLVTERSGALRLIENGRLDPKPVAGTPAVYVHRQGGLLDVAIDPDFADAGRIFLSFSEPRDDGKAGTAVARARLIRNAQGARLEDLKVIFRQNIATDSGHHFGSRLVFAADKTLYVTVGERGQRERAQDPFDHAGSVIRIDRDGNAPPDNPFADGKAALPEIWSMGHRNPQGAARHPETGALWTVEHGPRGGDEVNRPQPGRNYGWPVIGYGVHYSGAQVGVGTKKEGYEQPVYYWDPSIAPSGMTFYDGRLFPAWSGNLFVGALKFQLIARLVLDGDKIVHEERLLANEFGRIRDIRTGPDGALWLLTDEDDGRLLRITPGR